MNVIIVENPQEGAEKAFAVFKEAYDKGAQVFGLATGSTPEDLYALIRQSDLDFSEKYSINLDEYVGLAKEDEHSYHYFMEEHLFKAKPFKESFLPDGLAPDSDAETKRYESILSTYPIDFQLLGLGTNAHIGFNEPGTSFEQETHKVALAQETIEANKRFFEKAEDVPTFAYSMGLKSILGAKEIMLLAFGEKKAQAVRDMIEGPQTTEVPASILQSHPKVTIIVDKAAASLLSQS